MTKPTITATRSFPSGGWELSALVPGGPWGDYYETKLFLGYTKRDAIREFRTYLDTL